MAVGGCSPTALSASTVHIVALTRTSGRWRRSRARRLSSTVSPRAASATTRRARSVSVVIAAVSARRKSRARDRAERRGVGCDEPERCPGGQRPVRCAPLLGESAVRALAAREECRRTCSGPGCTGGRTGEDSDDEPGREAISSPTRPPCARVRPCRSSTRRSSGPATSASTRFPSACATLNATPAARTVTSAAQVWG